MKFYKNFLYGLLLVSCISGSIFAKSGKKSGPTTITLNAPNNYLLYKKNLPAQDISLYQPDKGTTNQYTFKPKTDDAQWVELGVYNTYGQQLGSSRMAEKFADHRYWDWTVSESGYEKIDPR